MMTSFRQFEANRHALRITGPKTDNGKRRSRANALQHGLTAETVIGTLEDAKDYKAFEATIIADYCPETAAVNLSGTTRELTYCSLRLANLDSGVFERLNRYEAALWRQTIQTLFALHPVKIR